MRKSFTSYIKWFYRETIFIAFQSNKFNLNFCTTKMRQIQLPLKLNEVHLLQVFLNQLWHALDFHLQGDV